MIPLWRKSKVRLEPGDCGGLEEGSVEEARLGVGVDDMWRVDFGSTGGGEGGLGHGEETIYYGFFVRGH